MGFLENASVAAAAGHHLGPATVTTVGQRQVELELGDGRHVSARLALASPYRPQAGDEVLAIGRDGAWYVIGVLEGRGAFVLTAPGDLEIAAPNGRISLRAGHGLELSGSHLEATFRHVKIAAETLSEKLVSARRWVAGLLEVRAGDSLMVVEDTHRLRAGTILAEADEQARINGRTINLG